ncbi:LPXTG cell wall anchor domain-containing protein [Streptomyces sp. NRRL S-1813]|uniref:LPXTG cell wall anchor domain-containing protein n=1 Tax=Streptomyces sp. NRRL S-1813 TaxID=1463888 RepID=UPI0004C4AE7C|nr:LPXTG cell wall anchor domain-containing protein [Streptomyces sp. NRRL S-1813]
MTLRQALTAAAAAAVIAPAAVLVTPAAASATEAPRPSAHIDDSQKTAAPERRVSDSARTEGATGPGGSSGTRGPTAETDEATKPGAGNGAGNGTKPVPDAKPGKETGTEHGTTSGGSSSEEVPPDGQCESSSQHLQMAIKGLQSGFVAGAGWSNSSITVTNTSDKAMEKVRPQPYISSAEIVDRPYEELEAQFRNPVTGKWLSFEDATVDSVFTGFPVAAHSTVTLPLRVRAINSAKPGAGYAIVEGMFSHQDGSCGLSNHEQYDFKILPARGKPGGPSKPGKPSESAEPAGGVTDGPRPQGGAKETSGAGQLAATGSSSALPTIALVGGVAMAVGAGAIISVRRRKAPAGSSGGGTGATA